MKNDEIKQANKKALPKFLIAMIISAIVGGTFGYFSGKMHIDTITDSMKKSGMFFGELLAPWIMLVIAVIIPFACGIIYNKSKMLFDSWDYEDNDVYDLIDKNISFAIWISSVSLVLSYFLIAATYSCGLEMFGDEKGIVVFFVSIVAFLAIFAETIIIQQKCVDITKLMNPEKNASIYDMKFQQKWLDDCDEAEKIVIGKCAYKAYSVTNSVCAILAIILALGALLFRIGFLPSLVVCFIWIINLSAYCKEALHYSKIGNKIS